MVKTGVRHNTKETVVNNGLRLAVGGGWQLAMGGSRRQLVVGGWQLVTVGGGWWWAVGGGCRLPVAGFLGLSLKAVLNKKAIGRLKDTPVADRKQQRMHTCTRAVRHPITQSATQASGHLHNARLNHPPIPGNHSLTDPLPRAALCIDPFIHPTLPTLTFSVALEE